MGASSTAALIFVLSSCLCAKFIKNGLSTCVALRFVSAGNNLFIDRMTYPLFGFCCNVAVVMKRRGDRAAQQVPTNFPAL